MVKNGSFVLIKDAHTVYRGVSPKILGLEIVKGNIFTSHSQYKVINENKFMLALIKYPEAQLVFEKSEVICFKDVEHLSLKRLIKITSLI